MRVLMACLMIIGGTLALCSTEAAQKAGEPEKKEVTLKGKVCCAKCELGVEKECMTVIVTKDPKDAKKDLTIYFDKASHTKDHAKICGDAKPGSVTGTVTDEGKKKIIAVKTLKLD
jgi:hypothetical protein